MIGNDVVDLDKARLESNWRHPRFLDKIFTSDEKGFIEDSTDPFQCIWRLWSMKESAYKAYVQQHKKTFFNPKRLQCTLINKVTGVVFVEGNKFTTVSEVSQSSIYTTAFSMKNSNYSEYFEVQENSQSKECHLKLIQVFAKKYQLNLNDLYLQKDSLGIPYIFYKNKCTKNSISITHHGRFGGISF